ncbi:MAG: hypothetical protein JW712_14295 [Dehalococcoidales bacterium]|nr:hypothetical protein [Dehalococcoidales bacterium]
MADKSYLSDLKKPIQGNPFLWLLQSTLLGWWFIISRILSPAILILSGALLYAEIDSIIEENISSASEILTKIGDDIMSNPILFIAFIIVFSVWVFTQFLKKDEIKTELKNINDKIDILTNEIHKNNKRTMRRIVYGKRKYKL